MLGLEVFASFLNIMDVTLIFILCILCRFVICESMNRDDLLFGLSHLRHNFHSNFILLTSRPHWVWLILTLTHSDHTRSSGGLRVTEGWGFRLTRDTWGGGGGGKNENIVVTRDCTHCTALYTVHRLLTRVVHQMCSHNKAIIESM